MIKVTDSFQKNVELLDYMEAIKKIEQYVGNRVKVILLQKSLEWRESSEILFKRIKKELGITSNKLTYLLNNVSEMLLSEAWVIADVLEVDIEDLIQVRKIKDKKDLLQFRNDNKIKRN